MELLENATRFRVMFGVLLYMYSSLNTKNTIMNQKKKKKKRGESQKFCLSLEILRTFKNKTTEKKTLVSSMSEL